MLELARGPLLTAAILKGPAHAFWHRWCVFQPADVLWVHLPLVGTTNQKVDVPCGGNTGAIANTTFWLADKRLCLD